MLSLPILSFIFTAFSAFAHPAALLERNELVARRTALPSADPFYAAPQNLSNYAPGAIIRSRKPPNDLGLISAKINVKAAWQILYRSTGALGEPLATVTTVIIPYNADFSKLLSYQVEIDAPYEGCFPSITLQQSNTYLDSYTAQYGLLWAISGLEKGWVVALPDHEGPNAAFTSGLVEGYTTLDGVRAALNSKSFTGVLPDAKVAIWGYSGGSLATEWALELQEEYAPELIITAAAIGGVPANLRNALTSTVNKKIGAGFCFSASLGLAKAYPAVKTFLDENLIADKNDTFYHAQSQCTIPTIVEFAYADCFSYFKDGPNILNNPIFDRFLQDNTMGNHGIPKVPIYLYHAINDELLPFRDTEALFNKYCASGANIQFSREAFGEHVIVALTGASGALKYLEDRFAGRALELGCKSDTVVSSILDPKNYEALGQIVFNIVRTILGRPVGPVAWIANAQRGAS